MHMTREGNVAYSTPLYCGLRVEQMADCQHNFKDSCESPAPYPNVRMFLQTCHCRATRVKLAGGTEHDLLKALE